jgi:hypothetical protein
MTIQITEKLVGMWQFEFGNGNFLGAVEDTEKGFKVIYRFRYYRDDKIGIESEDEKHWYEGIITDAKTREQAIHSMRDMLAMLNKSHQILYPEEDPMDVSEILMKDGDVEKFIQELSNLDSTHIAEEDIPNSNKMH